MVDVTKFTSSSVGHGNLWYNLALLLGLLAPTLLVVFYAFDFVTVSLGATLVIAAIGFVSVIWLAVASRRRLARISEAIDATQCSIVIYDEADRLIFGNRRYCEVLGVSKDDMVPGVHYSDLIRTSLQKHLPPEAIEAELAHRLAMHRLADGRPADRQYPNNKWERVTKTRLPSGLNVGIAVDVTEYYALKDQLDVEARRFAALARGAPVGICLVDGNASIQFVNDALLAMLDAVDRRALLDSRQTFRLNRAAIPSFQDLIGALRQNAAETEVRVDLPGTTRYLIVRKAFVPIAGGEHQPRLDGTSENLLIFVDITKRKAAEARVSYLALHDPLTGALNRVAFADDLAHASAGAELQSPAALIAIDLDRFKPVNDVHGHAVGDELLCRVVERIGAAIPESCRLYRLGGDEFAVLCPPPSGANAMAYARVILERLCEPFTIEGCRILIGASVGVSSLPRDTDNPETLIHYADLALYQGKNRGGGSVHAFSPAVLSSADTRRVMELDLAEAVENGDIGIVMQPIFGHDRTRPVAAETLARWTNRRTGECVSPATFIPIAEEANLIARIDLAVFRQAMVAFAQMRLDGAPFETLTVNVSMPTLEAGDFAAEVQATLLGTGVPGTAVVLEVTENFLVDDVQRLAATMETLSGFGIRFALDDFGTGYTSLRMLADLPVSYLKIDQSFVRGLSDPQASRHHRIVRAIIEMATHLGMEVIAEGVESEAAYDSLEALGCEMFQGFHLARPQPPESLAGGVTAGAEGTAAA
ncbi:bifunctional diguanylate cyclase/phosphodiesterase [Acuticoccus sp. I52.16.1]|uniref:putative bifunctional diguanylate cyclase/phosphodiesterase n=1 Tax=Acuticoccus sp. I52.16.1 TaxID=2928472 RepID=UPI001FD42681|nr:EAL domain-containing protein [Acuticoccus sp. I52.16.1]UOM35710.1 EAL domain-containing protein [Acuticoccus sp. I52.16.1]